MVFNDIVKEWGKGEYSRIEQALYGTFLLIIKFLDGTYQNRMVIDIMSQDNLIDLFSLPKISIIIESIWQGKYEMESFLNYSINYEIIKTILFKQVYLYE